MINIIIWIIRILCLLGILVMSDCFMRRYILIMKSKTPAEKDIKKLIEEFVGLIFLITSSILFLTV